MAEIKSAIELAMEKTKDLHLSREEMEKKMGSPIKRHLSREKSIPVKNEKKMKMKMGSGLTN